jgi:putative tricarboxylic transport membrane protein
LLPTTYNLPPTAAVIMMAGIFYGAMYGGSTTSILLNIPGEAASVVTCLDGYSMACQGRTGAALGLCAIGSFVAGTLSILGLSLLAPPLAAFALRFGPPEYFALVILGLLMAVYLSESSALKGLIMGVVGLIIGMVGLDPVHGAQRFTFGLPRLTDGVNFVVVTMGLFGIAEVLSNVAAPAARHVLKTTLRGLLPSREEWQRGVPAIGRGSLLGFLIGILPGGGATISSFIAYAVEKRLSRYPQRFGTGVVEGVAAPEAANNAAASSSFIPLLTLGIPGNASIAMIFVALLMHGIRPGPLLIQQYPDLFWGTVVSMYIGNLMLLILNLPLLGLWAKVIDVPYRYLAALVVVICLVGAYSVSNTAFDVGLMVFFGAVGYLFRLGGFPAAPLVLAMILVPQLERTLQQSLIASRGNLLVFVQRPIAATLLVIAALLVFTPLARWIWRRWRLAPDAMTPA